MKRLASFPLKPVHAPIPFRAPGLLLRTLLFLSILAGFGTSFAQWQPDVRLTFNDSASSISNNNSHARNLAAVPGGTLHTVWYDKRDGNCEIYYKRSSDGGTTWSSDVRLTNDPAPSACPAVAASGSQVHVVWADERDGNLEIYYKGSTDGGMTWGSDVRLTFDAATSWSPSVTAIGSSVHVVWWDARGGNSDIYYKRSTDGGTTWSADTCLRIPGGGNSSNATFPVITASGCTLHVVWQDERDSNSLTDLYYKRSTDGGGTWSPDTRLTFALMTSEHPAIWSAGPEVHLVWDDNRNNGIPEIYCMGSTDGGTTWSADTRLTYAGVQAYYPTVAALDSTVDVVWWDGRDVATGELYWKRSSDLGASWTQDVRLTHNAPHWGRVDYPCLARVDTMMHLVWQDGRDTPYSGEIYYKRNPNGQFSGVETERDERLPGKAPGLKAFPNPFASWAVVPGHENERFALYDLVGRRVGTYPGNRIGWDAPPGVYFLKSLALDSRPLRIVKLR